MWRAQFQRTNLAKFFSEKKGFEPMSKNPSLSLLLDEFTKEITKFFIVWETHSLIPIAG